MSSPTCTCADEFPSDVCACVGASGPIAVVPNVAGAHEATARVDTDRVCIAVVRAVRALVNVYAGSATPAVTGVASARETACEVDARQVLAVVYAVCALIHVYAGGTVPAVPVVAGAGEASVRVGAGGVRVTVVRTIRALVDVGAGRGLARSRCSVRAITGDRTFRSGR